MKKLQIRVLPRLHSPLGFSAGLLACMITTAGAAQSPEAARRAVLTSMVRQECGSCHGMTLKGGLGPALTPDALRDKPADSFVASILSGRNGTAMPPWRDFLSETEAEWIVKQLQRGTFDVRGTQ